MEVEEIKRIVRDQREDLEEKLSSENIIEREFLGYCKKFIAYPNVFLISGIRRSGKSVFSSLLFRGENFAYINFDDERLYGIEARELNKVMEAFYSLYGDVKNVILDEIQNVEGWELFAGRIRESKKVIVTGSNAKLLSSELATRLTGRYVEFTVYPFSFREFLEYRKVKPDLNSTKSIAQTKNLLEEYVRTGGFPEAYKFGERFLISLYESILTKDVVLRYRVRHVKSLKELSRLLMTGFASEITFNRLKNILGVKSVNTVKSYFGYLEQAFLTIRLDRFSFKLKEQMLAPKKTYSPDTGLVNAVGFQTSRNDGRLIENLVLIELLRKRSERPLLEIFYWKDHQQNEVDFVVKEGPNVRQLMQVCYETSDLRTRDRETKSLIKASAELKCKNLLVITWDHEGEEKREGRKIVYVPLWKWLLQPE